MKKAPLQRFGTPRRLLRKPFPRLIKKARMQGRQNPEEKGVR